MADIARAVLVGNLTRDPELNQTGKVLTLGMAVNRRVKNQLTEEWEEEVSFFDVKVLGNRAQALAGFLAKGRQVAVDARIVQERWDDKETGAKRSAVRFIADELVPLGAKGDTQQAAFPDADIPADLPPEPVAAAADDSIPF